jgi:hypothetical protein
MSTAYLDKHPADAAMVLGRVTKPFGYMRSEEYVQVAGYFDDRLVYDSGLIELGTLEQLQHHFTFYQSGNKQPKLLLFYHTRRDGRNHTVKIRLPSDYYHHHHKKHSGGVVVEVNGSNPAFPTAVHNARSRAARKAKTPSVRGRRRQGFPRKSDLRPSPEIVNRQFLRTVEVKDNAGGYTISQTVVPVQIFNRTWTGSRTPRFGKLKSRQLPVNPHTVKIVETKENKWTQHHSNTDGSYDLLICPYTEVIPDPTADPGHSPLARNKAIRKLIDEAELGIEGNLAQDIAQIGQLTTLIGGNAKKIVKAVHQVKALNFLGAVDTLTAGRRPPESIRRGKPHRTKDLADNWLELQYGWKPLLTDIEGTLQSLSNLQDSQDVVHSVRVSASKGGGNRFISFPGNGDINQLDKATSQLVWKTKCKLTLRYKIDQPLVSFLSQTGFLNPINLIWEILPFSFVADWFLGVGPYLEALSAWKGLSFAGGSQTLFTKATTETAAGYSGLNLSNPGSGNLLYRYGIHSAEVIRLDRTVLTDFPSMTFPSFKNGLESVQHAKNAIALVESIFRGR